jgi:thiol-disulfide isomerase/thioredoxin
MPRPMDSLRTILLVVCAALALSACQKPQRQTPPIANETAASSAAGPVKGIDRSHKGRPFPSVEFGDSDGTQTNFEGFEGVPTLVNLWATWCAPCVKELPTLARLGKAHKDDLWVVPISQDSAPRASVDAFLTKIGLSGFNVYYDPKMAISGAANAEVLPTTILYDAHGREVWRYVGDFDWTSREAARLIAEADMPTPR